MLPFKIFQEKLTEKIWNKRQVNTRKHEISLHEYKRCWSKTNEKGKEGVRKKKDITQNSTQMMARNQDTKDFQGVRVPIHRPKTAENAHLWPLSRELGGGGVEFPDRERGVWFSISWNVTSCLFLVAMAAACGTSAFCPIAWNWLSQMRPEEPCRRKETDDLSKVFMTDEWILLSAKCVYASLGVSSIYFFYFFLLSN